jgi:hypothetical protein
MFFFEYILLCVSKPLYLRLPVDVAGDIFEVAYFPGGVSICSLAVILSRSMCDGRRGSKW